MSAEGRWWYAVVRASPDPESGERANVALLIGNGRGLRLEYDPAMPRLKCIADPVERQLVREAVSDAEKRLGKLSDVAALRQHFGPQVVVDDPTMLFQRPDREVIKVLRDRYLGRERMRRSPDRALVMEQEIARIDATLRPVVSRHAFGLQIKKRPTPKKLYPDSAARIFETSVPALDRAIRGPGRDLLLGVATVDPRKPMKSLRDPSIRVGRAFWLYRENRELILQFAMKEVRTVGIIYNGRDDNPEEREAIEYISHVWSQDADAVVNASNPSDIERLEEQVVWTSRDVS